MCWNKAIDWSDPPAPDWAKILKDRDAAQAAVKPAMKSLAHPEWPYTGTPHEWRGFVTMGNWVMPWPDNSVRRLTKEEFEERFPYVAEKQTQTK